MTTHELMQQIADDLHALRETLEPIGPLTNLILTLATENDTSEPNAE